MADTAILDAPPAAPPDMMDAINEHNAQTPPSTVESTGGDLEADMLKRQAQAKAAPVVEKPVVEKSKVEPAKIEAKPKDEKDPLSKFSDTKPAEQPSIDEDKNKAAQSRWMELKGKEKRLGELEKEHTQKISEYEARIKELQEKAWKEEEKKEFDELRVKNKAWEVESTPEWNRQITVPFQQREHYINSAAKYYDIDPGKLWEALDLTEPFARNDKIEELIVAKNAERQAKAETDGTPFKPIPSTLGATLTQAGNDLQTIYQTMAAHRKNAMEQATALDSQRATQSKQSEEQEVAQYKEAATSIQGDLEKKFPDLFPNEETKLNGLSLKQAVAGAVPGDDARTIAYQTMAGEILPYLRHENLALREKIKAFEEADKARVAARPGMQQTDLKLPKEKDRGVPQSLEEAVAAQTAWARNGGS